MCDTSCKSSAKGNIMWTKDKLLTGLEADSCLRSVHWFTEKRICRHFERLPSLCLCPKAGPTFPVIPEEVTSSFCLLLCGLTSPLLLVLIDFWTLTLPLNSPPSIHPWTSLFGLYQTWTGEAIDLNSSACIEFHVHLEQKDGLNKILGFLSTWMILWPHLL